jgi:hypothetical protein
VTETQAYHNRVFYFRNELWYNLSVPVFDQLCNGVFEPVTPEELMELNKDPSSKYSLVRLLPKEKSLRPLMNLSQQMPLSAGGQSVGGVNKSLKTAFHILNFERVQLHSQGYSHHYHRSNIWI